MVLAPRDLINPDVDQSLQPVGVDDVGRDPLYPYAFGLTTK